MLRISNRKTQQLFIWNDHLWNSGFERITALCSEGKGLGHRSKFMDADDFRDFPCISIHHHPLMPCTVG
jgi:hypothetical protein